MTQLIGLIVALERCSDGSGESTLGDWKTCLGHGLTVFVLSESV